MDEVIDTEKYPIETETHDNPITEDSCNYTITIQSNLVIPFKLRLLLSI